MLSHPRLSNVKGQVLHINMKAAIRLHIYVFHVNKTVIALFEIDCIDYTIFNLGFLEIEYASGRIRESRMNVQQ